MKIQIDIDVDDETLEPIYLIYIDMPAATIEIAKSNEAVRAEIVKLIGTRVLDDVDAFIAKRKNEQLHTVTK